MAFIPQSDGFCFIAGWLLTAEGQFEQGGGGGGTASPLLTQNMSHTALVNFNRKIRENYISPPLPSRPFAECKEVSQPRGPKTKTEELRLNGAGVLFTICFGISSQFSWFDIK